MDIPETQRAAVKQGSGSATTIAIQDIPVPQPNPDQILVKINYSGLCASDKMIVYEEFQGVSMQPTANGIPGHEGAGVVVAVGSNVQHLWKSGDRAGIKWIAGVCRRCEFCTNGTDECHCPAQLKSGFSVAGTFQNYVATDAYYATRLPDGVKDEEAGPIMCGGVTAYVACKRSAVRPGQWVVILGAGGGKHSCDDTRYMLTSQGLGHLGVQV
jgi:propanol-preferring alcohol dehydrogenase